jgi:hypothetical protein
MIQRGSTQFRSRRSQPIVRFFAQEAESFHDAPLRQS